MPARKAGPFLLAGALLLLAVNLRLSIASVPPVLTAVRTTLGLSTAAAGVLTMLPVLCMGAFAPLAPRAAHRFGDERVLQAAILLLAAGVLIRLAPGVPALYAGTLVAGLAIAVLNVITPAVVKRDFARPGRILGLYSTTLTAGAALAAGLTVPLSHAFSSGAGVQQNGAGWRAALAVWAAPALVAALVWALVSRHLVRPPAIGGVRVPGPWRSTVAWWVTAYMSIQSLLFYAFISWVPDVLRDAGVSESTAGALLSLALLCGLPASMLVPMAAERTRRAGPAAVFAACCWTAGLVGLLASPSTVPALWMVLVGIGQGSTLSLALTVIVIRSADRVTAAGLSGMAQTVGYLVAALGPLMVGLLHSATGGWTVPLALLVGAAAASAVIGVAVDRGGPVQARLTPSSVQADEADKALL